MASSIITNVSAYYAQNNLTRAGEKSQMSIARLSSGNKIIRASDDVAALSIGTILRTNVSTLKTALNNTNQAATLLQVADGAIARLGEILQRQKALAVQANSGALSSTERGYLQQEFSALTSEYDRIVNNTNFNGVKLLDGTISVGGAAGGTGDTEYSTNDLSDNDIITAITDFDANELEAPGFAGDWSTATISLDVTAGENFTLTITIGDVEYLSTEMDSTTAAENNDIVFTGDDGSSFVISFGDSLDGEYGTNGGAIAGVEATLLADIQNVVMSGPGIEAPAASPYTVTGDTDGNTYFTTLPTVDAGGVEEPAFVGSWAGVTVSAEDDGGELFTLTITINGVDYVSTQMDSNDDAMNDDVVFTADDGSSFTLSFGDAFDEAEFSTAGDFGTLETLLAAELAAITVEAGEGAGATDQPGPLSFQVGTASTDTIGISIRNMGSTAIYLNDAGTSVTLNISTATGAVTASDVLDNAIKALISIRADVGALQSRFGYASAALEVSIQNLDAARGQFLDADISEESTAFATAQVLQQAAISVLAQANQLPQNLLKLIG